nr:MAG TPA: hypothetical protein [Caudoviricetes sp.]
MVGKEAQCLGLPSRQRRIMRIGMARRMRVRPL